MKKEIIRTIRCRKCGRPIAYIYRITGNGTWRDAEENTPDRFIDRWGFARNFCVRCVK